MGLEGYRARGASIFVTDGGTPVGEALMTEMEEVQPPRRRLPDP